MLDRQHRNIRSPEISLAAVAEGSHVFITTILGGCKLRERLLSMGINIADEIIVLQRRGQGAVVIAKGNNRYVLGGGMAQKIQVSTDI